MKKFVLDKGFVECIDSMGSDLTVANSARVSFDKRKSALDESDEKLIKYLAKHNHWTPFAHPQIQLHIKAPIFIRTQLFKSKVGFTENEVSRRYVKSDPEVYIPSEWRSAPKGSIKQGSGDNLDYYSGMEAIESYSKACNSSIKTYNRLLHLGLAPEIARGVLPQSMYTEWYWTGSLAAYARVYKQRSHESAQKESQYYAQAIGEIMKELFPLSWEALCKR